MSWVASFLLVGFLSTVRVQFLWLCCSEFWDRDLLFGDVEELHGVLAEVASVGAVSFVVLLDQDVSGEAQ